VNVATMNVFLSLLGLLIPPWKRASQSIKRAQAAQRTGFLRVSEDMLETQTPTTLSSGLSLKALVGWIRLRESIVKNPVSTFSSKSERLKFSEEGALIS